MNINLSRVVSTWIVVVLATSLPKASALTVTTSADELDSPGSGAAVSLREAIRDTPAGNTIDFDISLYGDVFELTMGELSISKDLTINASALVSGIIVDAAQSSRVLKITGSSVSITNVTFRNGSTTDRGGALYISNSSTVTLTDCQMMHNAASLFGGAIFCDSSVLTMDTCRVQHNISRTSNGGGIAISASSAMVMKNSSVSNNTSRGNGGGIFSTLANSINISNSSVNSNTAANGAGLYALATPLNIVSSTCSGNKASSNAGAIYATGDLDIQSCTIVDNHASITGGGLTLSGAATRSIINSIVAMNTSSNGPDISIASGALSSGGGNYVGSHNGCASDFPEGAPNKNNDYVGTDAARLDPLLAPLALYGGSTETMHPLAGSPVINMGVATLLTTDQRGFTRSSGAAIDIGAVETGPILTVTTAVDENNAGLGQGGGDSLRECLQAASGIGEHIQFSGGLSGQTILLTGGQMEIVTKSLFVDASSLAENISINADNVSRIFHLDTDAMLAMHSVNMGHGSVASVSIAEGGCIESDSSQLTVVDSLISDGNVSGTIGSIGGAVSIFRGGLTMVDCTLTGNSASSASQTNWGGGVALTNTSRGRFTRCRFDNNQLWDAPESSGAALYVNGEAFVQDCTFINNHASASTTALGGAIRISGIATLENSTFSNNSTSSATGVGAGNGGAVALLNSSILYATNCTFTNNTAEDDGGALHTSGKANMIHCSVVDNTASNGRGGGLRIASDSARLENNIIAKNTAGSSAADIDKHGLTHLTSGGANLIGDNSSVSTEFPVGPLAGTTASPIDPLLGSLGDYGGFSETLPPTPGSPALDAAVVATYSPATDQRYCLRPVGAAPDLGAYEAGHITGFAAWAAEKITPGLDAGFGGDSESDSNINGVEYATGRHPAVIEDAGILNPTRVAKVGGGYEMHLTFAYEPDAPDIKYHIQRSHNLTGFSVRYSYTPSTNTEKLHLSGDISAIRDANNKTITVIDDIGNDPYYFWRLTIEQLP